MKEGMNRLFVGYKPRGLSSRQFLDRLKRKYKCKKAGFSGTLDPFAKGALVIGFGNYTKLFNYLAKTPKRYRATLMLGAVSPTLDIEGIEHVAPIAPLSYEAVKGAVEGLEAIVEQTPPIYSAKKIEGRRAYDLARKGQEVVLKPVPIRVYQATLLHYAHPFIHFEVAVSEGSYVRSLGESVANVLGCEGALTSLERLAEGKLEFDQETFLDPLSVLTPLPNRYLKSMEDFELGRKLLASDFENPNEGCYVIAWEGYFSIIEIEGERAHYKLNKMER